jgi:hypothetical protein
VDHAGGFRIARPQHLDMHAVSPANGRWYVAGNVVEGFPEVSADNWKGGVQFDGARAAQRDALAARVRASEAIAAAPVTRHSAEEAYRLVLAQAGAVLPSRDAVDRRVAESVRSGSPAPVSGIIKDPALTEAMGKPNSYREEPTGSTRYEELPDQILDSTKIHTELRWRARTDLRSGLLEAFAWYRTHQDVLRPLYLAVLRRA